MSLQVLNDKNVSSEKSTENCDFLFSSPEVTGRSSVLRVSQKENVPPKNVAKAMKVTFQTPLRDPQTHRILSPSMASKLEAPLAQGDTLGLENCHPVWTQKENQQLIKKVDAKTTHGILQKPMEADTDLLGDASPAFGSGSSSKPGPGALADLDCSSSSQSPGSSENQMVSPEKVSGSPEQALEENVSSYSLDRKMTPTSETLEDPSRTESQHEAETPHRAKEEGRHGGVSAPTAVATSPPSAIPEEACGGAPLGGLPGEALACPVGMGTPVPADDTQALPCAHTSGPESTAPTSHLVTGRAMTLSPQEEAAVDQMASSSRSGPIKLEFDLSDGATSKRAPPPRRLGERSGLKPPLRRAAARQQKAPREVEEDPPMPASRGSYHLDWDKLDDPNFNPFRGDTLSGHREAQPPESPETRLGRPASEQLSAGPAMEEPGTCVSQQRHSASAEDTPVVQLTAETPRAESKEGALNSASISLPTSCPGSEPVPTHQQGQPALELKEESFRDPAEVLGTGAEVDYLEQFGTSSFKESALRKQSLYLKFDPLLRDSPRGPVPVAMETSRCARQPSPTREALSVGRLEAVPSMHGANEPPSGSPREAKLVEFDFLGALDIPVPGPPPGVPAPGGPPLSTGPIVDLLQYSQKDLDAAVRTKGVAIPQNLQATLGLGQQWARVGSKQPDQPSLPSLPLLVRVELQRAAGPWPVTAAQVAEGPGFHPVSPQSAAHQQLPQDSVAWVQCSPLVALQQCVVLADVNPSVVPSLLPSHKPGRISWQVRKLIFTRPTPEVPCLVSLHPHCTCQASACSNSRPKLSIREL